MANSFPIQTVKPSCALPSETLWCAYIHAWFIHSYHCVKIFILQEYDHMPPVKLLDDVKVGLGSVSTGRQKLKVYTACVI